MSNNNDTYRTVTFLFGDIEGSTKLLQKLGDKYSGLLEEQQRILREEIEKYDGDLSDITGDGFFGVFKTAENAVQTAAAIQKRMSTNKWINGSQVKIRMGIHTGKTKISKSGYTGLDVHRAARIMSSAYGGQVLVSEAAKVIAENYLTKDISLKYLGEHNLKDIPNAEKIYQLVIENLESEFPKLRSAVNPKTNFPSVITKLIGREKEFESLKEILTNKDTRLVTITGPGGVGKTTLGLNVCVSLITSFKDGAYVIYLSDINEIELVNPTIGKELGLSESNSTKHLISFLENKNVLLFLDNFEQVINASDIVLEIIQNCPGTKILVSSRMQLHISIEREFQLNSLALPDEEDMNEPEKLALFPAVQLFEERARKIDKNFKITKENAETIAKICIQLDGLPLAIELACARIKLFTPQMLLSRLSNKLSLLKGSSKDLPERHQTLRQTVMWSYDLLSEEEKRLFEVMSIFSGGFSLDAIEKVCGEYFMSELELFDAVQALVDKSLLRKVDTDYSDSRFKMLLTIREFSSEQFDKCDDFKGIKDKHAYYYLKNAEEAEPYLTGKDIKYWSDVLDADIDNYRGALNWSEKNQNSELALRLCASLWRFWIVRRNLREGYEKMKYVLSMPYSEEQKPLRAKVLNGIGTIVHELNDYDVALPLIEESISLYSDIGDKSGELFALINLCWVLVGLGQLDKAEEISAKCMERNKELGSERAYSLIYNNLGWLNFIRGNLTDSRDYYRKSLEKRVELGDKRGEGFALSNVGWIEIILGDYDNAEEHFKQSLEILSELSDKQLTGWALSNYGFLEICRGNLEQAEKYMNDAISQMKESVHEWSISYETLLYGLIKYYLGDKQLGIDNISKGLAFYREIKNIWGTKRGLLYLGNIYLEMSEIEKAKQSFREALEISIALKDKLGYIQSLESAALVCLYNNNDNEAGKFYTSAKKIREDIQAPMNFIELKVHKENIDRLQIQTSDDIDLEKVIYEAKEILDTN